jgi:signal peptidase I
MTPHTRRKLIHYWRRHIRPILVLVLVFTAFRSSFADWNDVPTGSMKPTIFEGDRIFVNKLAYGLKFPYTTWHLAKWSGPQRGEIAVFYSPKDGIRLVKRVVGLPGDHIVYRDGFLTINGRKLEYRRYDPPPDVQIPEGMASECDFYLEQLGDYQHIVALLKDVAIRDRRIKTGQPPPNRDYEITVPEGKYFMMGDNRDNSNDSRFIGSVERTEILGRSSRTIFSLDYNDSYLPRKNRFFHGLN